MPPPVPVTLISVGPDTSPLVKTWVRVYFKLPDGSVAEECVPRADTADVGKLAAIVKALYGGRWRLAPVERHQARFLPRRLRPAPPARVRSPRQPSPARRPAAPAGPVPTRRPGGR